MQPIQYNTQLNTKPVIMYIFTYWQFFLGVIISAAPAFICTMFGIDPPLIDSIVIFIVYSLIIGYYKAGKPQGYLGHKLKHYITPEIFRPGKRFVQYPVRMNDIRLEVASRKMSPEELKDDLLAVQEALVKNNIIPGYKYASPIVLDENDEDTKELREMALEQIKNKYILGRK